MHGGFIVYNWIDGTRFIVKSGDTGLTGNIYTGLHEFTDMSFVLHLLRENDLFIDVGANLGSYTLLACSVAGARGISLEPVPGTFSRLRENVKLNNLDSEVLLLQAGVGNEHAWLPFTTDNDTTNHALASGEVAENVEYVDVLPLDEVLEREDPVLIKVDTEGFETKVLEGAENTLGKNSLLAIIIELNDSGNRYGHSESKILELLDKHDFVPVEYDPFNREIRKLKGKNFSQGNTIFVRTPAIVVDRVRSAKKIAVHNELAI